MSEHECVDNIDWDSRYESWGEAGSSGLYLKGTCDCGKKYQEVYDFVGMEEVL